MTMTTDENVLLDDAEQFIAHWGALVHQIDRHEVIANGNTVARFLSIIRSLAATPQSAAREPGGEDLRKVYDAFGFGESARTITALLSSIRNVMRFADQLDAIEREFFMVPGEPDEDFPDDEPEPECLLNRWGSTVEEYVEQFRAALRTRTPAPAEDLPAFLERIADELEARDTAGGTFAPGVASSLRGRAIILRAALAPEQGNNDG